MSKTVPGPLSEGTAAFPWPRPRRGEFDQLVWDGFVYSCEDGYRPLFLDLHVPRADPGERLPVVLWIHGGGWAAGSRRRMSPNVDAHWLIGRTLLAGFAVALVDYRLVLEAAFPAPVADVRAAVRWLRANAGDLGLDPSRFALWGESAGGHIACMAAACDREIRRGHQEDNLDRSEDVQAVVDWYGPADLSSMPRASGAAPSEELPRGGATVDVLTGSDWDDAAASPLTYARPGLPPLLVAHGRDDDLVPVAQSRSYCDALRAAGADVEYVETDGGHVFDGADVMGEMVARALDFLGSRLGTLGQPSLDPAIAAAELRGGFHPPRPYPVEPHADTAIEGPAGQVALRIQRPVVPSDVVVVYAHGGGSGAGDKASRAASATRIAASTPATVVQADYRLAPEHPFTAGLEDFRAAVLWAAEHLGELGGGRLVLAGGGAGGDLAAATALHCRDEGIELAGLFLLYAATGALPDLQGLPPTIVGVGALDLLFEDNLAFVQRLRAVESPVTLRVFPTLGHDFFGYAAVSPAADRACEQVCSDLNRLMWDSTAPRKR